MSQTKMEKEEKQFNNSLNVDFKNQILGKFSSVFERKLVTFQLETIFPVKGKWKFVVGFIKGLIAILMKEKVSALDNSRKMMLKALFYKSSLILNNGQVMLSSLFSIQKN